MNTSDLENAQTAAPPPPQQVNASSPVAADAAAPAEAEIHTSASTLLEFPGANRNRPAWRKELSERVREIQQRRARDAALEAEETARRQTEERQAEFTEAAAVSVAASKAEERARQLGLVPPPPELPVMNPIVVAALKRIERARIPSAPRGRANRAGHATATAAARVVEERYEPKTEAPPAEKPALHENPNASLPASEASLKVEKAEPRPDSERLPNLVAVPPKPPAFEKSAEAQAKAPEAALAGATVQTNGAAAAPIEQKATAEAPEAVAASVSESNKPQPRRIEGVIDDNWLERRGADPLPKVVGAKEMYDDRASLGRRSVGAFVDLLVVAFLSAPFAAIIELTIGNWGDPRVQASMGGIVVVMMFLYLTCSTALAGRTWGMSLFSLHTVDADTALAPTTGQCARRTLVYMLSLATFGLGLLYALFDAEGRTAHDLLSRTVIVKE